jgi:alkylhydroperoxidase family enzyme
LFTPLEKAVLQLTEEVTLVSEKGISGEPEEKIRAFYTEKQIAKIILQVIIINRWNRIAIAGNLIYKD